MVNIIFTHLYLYYRRSTFWEGAVIVKVLRTFLALLFLLYSLGAGLVASEVLQKMPQTSLVNNTLVFWGIGFVLDFLLKLCVVKCRLPILNGYVLTSAPKRVLLTSSILINTVKASNFIGALIITPIFIQIHNLGLLSSWNVGLFLLLTIALSICNSAISRSVKSHSFARCVITSALTVSCYLMFAYWLLRNNFDLQTLLECTFLLTILIASCLFAFGLEYNTAKRLLYKSLGDDCSALRVRSLAIGGLLDIKDYMFPLLSCIRNKNSTINVLGFELMGVSGYFISVFNPSPLFRIIELYFLVFLVVMPALLYSPFTFFLSEYMDGLVTMRPGFVRRMICLYHHIFSLMSLLGATVAAVVSKDILMVSAFFAITVSVFIPIIIFETSYMNTRGSLYIKPTEFKVVNSRVYLSRSFLILGIIIVCLAYFFLDRVWVSVSLLTISGISIFFLPLFLSYIADRFEKNRHEILTKMRS